MSIAAFPWLRWSGRAVLGAAALWAAGCQRANPLDLEVKAVTPYEFLQWHENVLSRQPEGVVTEFNEAVGRVIAGSPSQLAISNERTLRSRHHPICLELKNKTVREVIIAGYSAANAELLRGMILQSDNLIGALKYDEVLHAGGGGDAKRVERLVQRRTAMIGAAKAQVEANRRRMAELQRDNPAKRVGFFVRFSRWRLLTFILP